MYVRYRKTLLVLVNTGISRRRSFRGCLKQAMHAIARQIERCERFSSLWDKRYQQKLRRK